MMKPLIYIFAVLASAPTAWGHDPVPECRTKPEFYSHGKVLTSIKDLPNLVFVGKRAIYYVENKATGFRLVGEQSFIKGKSGIVCASMPAGSAHQSFSIYAPTLIDLSGDKSIGDSYWQFHMIANPKEFGIWNKKSRLFSKTKDLESGLAKIGAQVQIIQISRDQFEIQFSRESEKANEVLSIRFDALSQIP